MSDPAQAAVWAEVIRLADDTLNRVQADWPTALAGATAWVLGTVIRKNTFSPLDGSRSERIGERLKGLYAGLEGAAEGRFYAWLVEGFREAREYAFDELDRWKLGIQRPQSPR